MVSCWKLAVGPACHADSMCVDDEASTFNVRALLRLLPSFGLRRRPSLFMHRYQLELNLKPGQVGDPCLSARLFVCVAQVCRKLGLVSTAIGAVAHATFSRDRDTDAVLRRLRSACSVTQKARDFKTLGDPWGSASTFGGHPGQTYIHVKQGAGRRVASCLWKVMDFADDSGWLRGRWVSSCTWLHLLA